LEQSNEATFRNSLIRKTITQLKCLKTKPITPATFQK
jgi:hypothetical protein